MGQLGNSCPVMDVRWMEPMDKLNTYSYKRSASPPLHRRIRVRARTLQTMETRLHAVYYILNLLEYTLREEEREIIIDKISSAVLRSKPRSGIRIEIVIQIELGHNLSCSVTSKATSSRLKLTQEKRWTRNARIGSELIRSQCKRRSRDILWKVRPTFGCVGYPPVKYEIETVVMHMTIERERERNNARGEAPAHHYRVISAVTAVRTRRARCERRAKAEHPRRWFHLHEVAHGLEVVCYCEIREPRSII
ncbi:hypothetical protein EVAR_79776_1 [Eumeta japonica]|uniref:Uncharacterized protein n=1 Tax=Eumeta variegata TaxID=151549 RepID=A0A4C1TCT8_EUMVA|nr:hypothetical protein EVAR_79776_1 [Eumeta japonica]